MDQDKRMRECGMNEPSSRAALANPLNISLICGDAGDYFVTDALKQLALETGALLIADDPDFLPDYPKQTRLDFSQVGLDDIPIKMAEVSGRIQAAVEALPFVSVVIVDMRWGAGTISATANFERWGGFCDRISEGTQVPIVSIYARSLMIEDQMLAAVRGHSHFLAPSGLYDNPFWLPPAYQTGATISQQIGFVLGRLVPDYEDALVQDDGEASGANPQWITAPAAYGRVWARMISGKSGVSGGFGFICQTEARSNGTFREVRPGKPRRCSPISCNAGKRVRRPIFWLSFCGLKSRTRTRSASACTMP
ncbi:hypothetical protein [Marivivens sp. JLT3646]|uniref:hypothetical protein n=1 Tax=Marivivens sp. JLT3646 TaxID=1920883 RepID=UPI001E3BD0DD|nr:hypothetical protein [Marivivens sp. JLT3646]